MNEEITYQVLQNCVMNSVAEFVVCAGSRNSSFVEALRQEEQLITYYWPEERSAAFFALGRSKLTGRPVAIVTTSGTAAAELLPATMEAFYSGIPLILITADRPEVFRGSGAPQSAEQVGLFGHYVQFCQDITTETPCCLEKWLKKNPVHLNVCLEEPQKQPPFKSRQLLSNKEPFKKHQVNVPCLNLKTAVQDNKVMQNFDLESLPIGVEHSQNVKAAPIRSDYCSKDFVNLLSSTAVSGLKEAQSILTHFLDQVECPIAIVSTLRPEVREDVVSLLLKLEIPVMLEGVSGLREDSRLLHMSIQRTDKVLETALEAGYTIDGVLRIGGVPTHRIWRDLEYVEEKIKMCTLSEQPFSGLSWTRCVAEAPIDLLLKSYISVKHIGLSLAEKWLKRENAFKEKLIDLFQEESQAEPSLIYALSKQIPQNAHIYLGNSLPIREWDMAAVRENKNWEVDANRGVNGIDGQISTFLGLCRRHIDNWGIFGDLTALYDMAGFWVLPNLVETSVKVVIINNGGGKIFERMCPFKEMLNEHKLSFRPLAEMWSLDYICVDSFPDMIDCSSRQMIEVVPDDAATKRFWNKYELLEKMNSQADLELEVVHRQN